MGTTVHFLWFLSVKQKVKMYIAGLAVEAYFFLVGIKLVILSVWFLVY